MPKFVLKDMEGLYIEEMNISISTLRGNLESLPVQQGGRNEKKSIIRGIKPRSGLSDNSFTMSSSIIDAQSDIGHG